MPIIALLSIDPPSLPKENMSNAKVKKVPPFSLKRNGCIRKKTTPPSLPPRRYSSVEKEIFPQLPLKQYRYDKNGHKVIMGSESKIYHTVKSYTVRGMKLYECNHITFLDQTEAKRYCQIINNNKGSKKIKNLWQYTLIIRNSRKNSISENNDSLIRRKSSSLGSRNSLSQLNRSSSEPSLTKSNSDFSLKKSSVFKSNSSL